MVKARVKYIYIELILVAKYNNVFLVLAVEGEMLTLSKVTRSEMGGYLCIASNGVSIDWSIIIETCKKIS